MDPYRVSPPALTHAEVLRAVTTAFSQPELLVRALREADSDEEAVDAVSRALELSPAEARVVLDQPVRLITRANVNVLRHELEAGSGAPER